MLSKTTNKSVVKQQSTYVYQLQITDSFMESDNFVIRRNEGLELNIHDLLVQSVKI